MAIPLRLIEQLYAFFKEFPSVLALNTSMKWKMESYRIQMVNTCLFSMLEQHVFKPIEWQLRVEKKKVGYFLMKAWCIPGWTITGEGA